MIKPDRIVTTTCPYCGVGCTLQLHVKDDYIYKVTSPFDSPVNHGNLFVNKRYPTSLGHLQLAYNLLLSMIAEGADLSILVFWAIRTGEQLRYIGLLA